MHASAFPVFTVSAALDLLAGTRIEIEGEREREGCCNAPIATAIELTGR